MIPKNAVRIPNYYPYWITKEGKVYSEHIWNGKSVGEIKPKIVKPKNRENTTGYLRYSLQINGIPKAMLLHRLLALTFTPNPNNYPQVNHKDGNKLNNSLDNLEWCNNKQNQIHAHKLGLQYREKGIKNSKSKPILQLKNNKIVGMFENSIRAAEQLGYCQHNITTVARGVRPFYKGFNWKFISKEEYCQRVGIELHWKEQR